MDGFEEGRSGSSKEEVSVRDVSERKELLESESESPVSDRVKLRVAEEDGAE